jgi:hypothetical protein
MCRRGARHVSPTRVAESRSCSMFWTRANFRRQGPGVPRSPGSRQPERTKERDAQCQYTLRGPCDLRFDFAQGPGSGGTEKSGRPRREASWGHRMPGLIWHPIATELPARHWFQADCPSWSGRCLSGVKSLILLVAVIVPFRTGVALRHQRESKLGAAEGNPLTVRQDSRPV